MRKMRKFISLAVVFTMICSMVLTGFANASSDIEGTKYEEAIAKLVALDTIKGYEDGTFKPESTITRAELATVITFILGLQDAADLAKDNPTRFSDVKVNEWYTGYINIAANENVIAGYPDGTFRPNEKVSNSEAVTMLVNSLGLKQVVDKAGGTWPSNYMSKASQLGITKVLSSVDGTASAIRGDVFMMAWETLLQNQWGAIGFNDLGEINYGNLGKSLLESKYPDYVYNNNGKTEPKYFEEILVVNTPATKDTLKSNQIEIELENIAKMINVTLTQASDTKPYMSDDSGNKIVVNLPEETDASSLLGKEVTIFFGKDNEIKYIKATSDAVSGGELESIDSTNSKVKIDGTKYTLTKDADVYVNNIEINDEIKATSDIENGDVNTKLEYLEELIEGMDGTIRVETLMNSSNKITSLQVDIAGTFDIEKTDDSKYEFEQFIVKSIRSDSTLVDLNGTRKFKTDDIDDEDSNIVVVRNGKSAKAEDIEVGDVVMTAKNPDGDIRVITVTNKRVSGTLDRVASGYALKIDGTTYELGQDARLSTENDIEETVTMSSDISTLLDSNVELYLDSNGNYILAMGESEVTLAMQYGIVARTPAAADIMYDDNDEPYLRLQIVDEKGNKIGYKVTGDTDSMFKQAKDGDIEKVTAAGGNDWTDEILTAFTKGTLVGFSTDSTGRTIKINNLTKLENSANAPTGVKINDTTTLSQLTIPDTDSAVKDSTKSFKASDGKTYYVTSNTIILNKNADNIEVVDGWATLVSNSNQAENMLRNTKPYAVFETKSRIIKYLIVDNDGTGYQATKDKYGIITDISVGTNDDKDKVWQVTVYSEGEEMTYEVADVGTDLSTVLFGQEGDVVRYDIKDDKFVQTGSSDVKLDMEAFLDDKDYDGFITDGIADRDQLLVDDILDNLIVFKKVDGEAIDPISVSDDVIVYDLSGSEPQMSGLKDLDGRMIMFLDTDGDTAEYEIIIILE